MPPHGSHIVDGLLILLFYGFLRPRPSPHTYLCSVSLSLSLSFSLVI
uniref:Uncharacterized protein n=1 Tax=Setaria viridis TaxID=4556 RepID=A0A4U6TB05_SETVI|nr:hypothetical protein SEVIR_9G503350v2 [Setaria viridis]